MAFQVVSLAQRARRRQQRPPIDDQRQILAAMRMDAELRAQRERRRQDRLAMIGPASYYGERIVIPRPVITCAARWSAALEAARTGAPLEGQGA